MSAIEEKTIDVFGATLSRRSSSRAAARWSSASASSAPAGVGGEGGDARPLGRARDSLDATLPSSWLTINADNTILMRTGQGRDGAGLGEHRVRADPRRGAERAVLGDHEGRHGRHRPHARRRHRGRVHGPAAPEPPQGRRLHLPGAARPGLDAARRPGREPHGHERRRLGRRQERQLRPARHGPAAEPDDPGHRRS